MNNMSFMEKLLDGVEMEWKPLGEVGEFTYGYAAKAQDSGSARFIRISDININGRLIQTDAKEVRIYSPMLSDLVALSSSDGVDKIADKVKKACKNSD